MVFIYILKVEAKQPQLKLVAFNEVLKLEGKKNVCWKNQVQKLDYSCQVWVTFTSFEVSKAQLFDATLSHEALWSS